MRDGMLVCPVVIHHPDLFRTGAVAHKINLGLSDAIDAAAQPVDDRICEPVRHGPRHVLAGGLVVLLGQHLRIARVSHVVKPAVDHQAAIVGR